MPNPSKALALLAFFGLVPVTIWLAFRGHGMGLYSYEAVPIAFGVIFAVSVSAYFLLITAVADRWG